MNKKDTFKKIEFYKERILLIAGSYSDGVMQKKLEELLMLSPARVSEILHPMEMDYLIKREPYKQDKRKKVITLTECGISMYQQLSKTQENPSQKGNLPKADKAAERKIRTIKTCLSLLSKSELKTFIDLLNKICEGAGKTDIDVFNEFLFDMISDLKKPVGKKRRTYSPKEKEIRKSITKLKREAEESGIPIIIAYYSPLSGFSQQSSMPWDSWSDGSEKDAIQKKFIEFMKIFMNSD